MPNATIQISRLPTLSHSTDTIPILESSIVKNCPHRCHAASCCPRLSRSSSGFILGFLTWWNPIALLLSVLVRNYLRCTGECSLRLRVHGYHFTPLSRHVIRTLFVARKHSLPSLYRSERIAPGLPREEMLSLNTMPQYACQSRASSSPRYNIRCEVQL